MQTRRKRANRDEIQITHFAAPRNGGFALVVALTLMAFILLLVVSLASLARVETLNSSNQMEHLQARQNALLSLNVALGELQKQTGPDQRITATSSILDSDPATSEIDGQEEANWTGVWDNSGNLLTWLVSGNEGLERSDTGFIEPDSLPAKHVALADDNSANAPYQSINDSDGYAYRVSDEGTKAKIKITGSTGSSEKLLSAQKADITQMTDLSWVDKLTAAELDRISFVNELSHGASDAVEIAAIQDRIHDLTTSSYGLLTDVRNGGFKKDLTLALYDGSLMPAGQIFAPVSGSQSDSDPGGPLWAQLQDWATISLNTSDELRAQSQSQDHVGISPIITHFQLYILPRYDPVPSGAGKYQIYLDFLPAVTLWNPYSYPLETTDYRLDFGQTFYQVNSTTETIHHYDQLLTAWDIRLNGAQEDLKINTTGRLSLNLSNVRLEPGEAISFSPPSGSTLMTEFNRHSKPADGQSELLPGFRPRASYYINTSNTIDSSSSTPPTFELLAYTTFSNSLRLVRRDDESVLYQTFYLSGWINTAAAPTPMQAINQPIMSMHGSIGMKSIHNFVESNTADNSIKWLANYNPRAATHGANPLFFHHAKNRNDVVYSRINNPSYEAFVKLNGDEQDSSLPVSGDQAGVGYSTNPVYTQSCVLFDRPPTRSELHSIGQLMDAPLYYPAPEVTTTTDLYTKQNLETKYRLQWGRFDNLLPAYAIGNSLAPASIDLDSIDTNWSDYPPPSSQYFNYNYTNIKGLYYDYSYLLNKAIWDSYFFSTLPDASSRLPANLRLVPLDSDATTALTSETAAAQFLLDGAYNINSTSEEAWRSILAYSFGVTIEADQAEGAPYLRVLNAQGEAFDPDNDDEYETAGYHGYRTLTADQIKNLARQIVKQIKWRGPFTSLAGFVNRNPDQNAPAELGTDAFRLKGALAAALEAADTISNDEANELGIDPEDAKINISLQSSEIETTPRTEAGFNQAAQEGWRSEGIPGWLTQADLLARLGSTLTARSDTFKIHVYGQHENPLNGSQTQVQGEAIVQRLPEYIDNADAAEISPTALTQSVNQTFGRRYKIVSFRWLDI
ncbi:hypothetical protein [Coraliomargarita parva]|uniref:hypothetical protein n=1 Tax=Coraliomargarita parva TaxID=3014050 RepID=UPI0022B45094|nr:hypothetical protein [Coraliomargarita parva]